MDTMSQAISRAAALIEIDGEVLLLNLSAQAWQEVLSIAARDAGGTLPVARVPNQAVLDSINVASD